MKNAKKPTFNVSERQSITERPDRPVIDSKLFDARRNSMVKKVVRVMRETKAANRKSSNTNRKGKA